MDCAAMRMCDDVSDDVGDDGDVPLELKPFISARAFSRPDGSG